MQKERKRRRNGEGCYSVRKDGRIVYKVRNGTNERGKPHYIEGYGKTEREAYQNYLDKLNGVIKPRRKKEASQNIVIDSNKLMYFDEYIRFWMDYVKKPEVKPQSLARIRQCVESYIVPYLGHYVVEEITEELIRGFLDYARCSCKLGYWSIHKVYTHLKACLNFALAKGKINKHPMILVKHPKKQLFPDNEIKIIPDETVKLLAKEAVRKYNTGLPVYRHGLSMLLILLTGMRPSEACAAKISNYNVETGVLKINSTIVRLEDTERINPNGKKSWKLVDQPILKTATGKRVIRLNAQARKVVSRLIEKSKVLGTKYLICDKKGNPVHERYVNKSLTRMLRAIHVEHYTLYVECPPILVPVSKLVEK